MTEEEVVITAPVYNETICLNILDYLQDWTTVDNSVEVDGEKLQLNADNVVPIDEVERYFNRTLIYVQNYLCREIIPDVPEIVYAVCKWTAGLLYKKYNIRANDNMEDDQMQIGYGDFLIKSAKEELVPYMYSKLSMW